MSVELNFAQLLERNPEPFEVWKAGDLWYWRWSPEAGPQPSIIGAEDLLTMLDLPLDDVRSALWYDMVWHQKGITEPRWIGVVAGHLKRVRYVLSPNWQTGGGKWMCPSCHAPLHPSLSGRLWCDNCRIEVIEHTEI